MGKTNTKKTHTKTQNTKTHKTKKTHTKKLKTKTYTKTYFKILKTISTSNYHSTK